MGSHRAPLALRAFNQTRGVLYGIEAPPCQWPAGEPLNRAQPRTRPNTAIMGYRSRPLFVRPAAAVLGAIFGACLSTGLSTGLSAAGAQSPDTRSRDAAAFAALEIAETEAVVEIVDGDTLVLADGRQVRLVGLQAPGRYTA